MKQKIKAKKGFTLIEVVVGTAIAAILIVGVLSSYSILTTNIKVARQQTILSSLTANYLEIVKNLPYSQIGTVNGNPSGTLADSGNPISTTIEGLQFRVYYEVTYIDDPADGTVVAGTDVAPNDYKQVKMSILNVSTNKTTWYLTNVSPKGLENTTNAGAIWVKVFDATGQPVSGASVHIENLALNPDIQLDRQTDSAGNWVEVGLPASANNYHIVVTKAGMSTDQTYPITVANPNPTKPDSTVVNGTVTQISFAIDLLSNLTIRTLDQNCQDLSGINMNVRGAKQIGNSPVIYKFNNNYSSVAGQIVLSNIEWDTYTPTMLTGQNYTVYGTSPIQQIIVLPGTNQTFTIVLGPLSTNSILVIVKDAATGAALEGAALHLKKSTSQEYFGATGGSVWLQKDWTGGSGQVLFTNQTKYFVDDGNVNINSAPTGLRLKKTGGNYALSGNLESSTFDTQLANNNFSTISWEPTSQIASTAVKFQIASNNDNLTWNFKGPDGTASTYYTVPGTSVNPLHDNNRYFRYKAFLTTTNNKKTPVLTSLQINYVTGCGLPGQAVFPGLNSGQYDLDVALAGYATKVISNMNINGNQTLEVLMSP